jgi:3-hydroxyisobutyrate dehydrogenase-like beta-hydroxyacid dehydrogenase
LREGAMLIETSTVSPGISRRVGEAASAARVHYLRSPVSGSVQTAAEGKLIALASGPRNVFEVAKELIEAYAAKTFWVGQHEEARYLKLMLNTLTGATSALLAEALSLGRSGGLSTETMLDVLSDTGLYSALIAYKHPSLVRGDYTAAFSVTQMAKDFDLIVDTARYAHVPLFLAALIRQKYEAAIAQGAGEQDYFCLYDQQLKLSGLVFLIARRRAKASRGGT